MTLLCDVHIPLRLNSYLKKLNHHSIHINEILEKWHTKDDVISRFADEQDLIVITKDGDFKNSFLLKMTPKKLIKINTALLIQLFAQHMQAIEKLNNTQRKFMLEVGSESASFTLID